MVFIRIPPEAINPAEDARDTVSAEVLTRPEGGEAVSTGTIDLRITDHYIFDEQDNFLWPDTSPLVPIAGNVVTFSFRGAPYEWVDGRWVLLEVPFDEIQGSVRPHYQIINGDLHWIPVTETSPPDTRASFSQRMQMGDGWVAIGTSGELTGIAITDVSANTTQIVSAWDAMFTSIRDYVLLPNAEGGYWFMEDEYRYVRLDSQFRRQDALSFAERLARLFGAYPRYDPIWFFYRENGFMKQITVPLMLFFIPVGFIAVGMVTQILRRPAGITVRSRFLKWAGAMSLVYLMLVLFLRSEYWATIQMF